MEPLPQPLRLGLQARARPLERLQAAQLDQAPPLDGVFLLPERGDNSQVFHKFSTALWKNPLLSAMLIDQER